MKNRESRICVILLVLAIFSTGIVSAATVSWTNTSGGNWSEPANWNPNQTPGPGDTAVITDAGIYTVTLDVSATIDGLALGGASGHQTLVNSSTTLTLNNASGVNSNGVFAQSGGALNGSGLLTIDGVLEWTGGSFSARLTVASNGMLNLGGNGYRALFGALTNAGLIRVTGAGQFNLWGSFPYDGRIENLTGGVIDFEADAPWYGVLSAKLCNAGTMRKTGGSDTTLGGSGYPISFENSGTVTVLTGTINFPDSGSFGGLFEAAAAGTAINFNGGGSLTGTFTAAAGATITLTGGVFTYAPSLLFNGAGVSRMTGGTLLSLDELIPNLQLLGGTVSLSPSFQGGTITNLSLDKVRLSGQYTVSGTFNCGAGVSGSLLVAPGAAVNWIGGSYSGALTVASNGVLNVGLNAFTTLAGALTNSGLLRVTGGAQLNLNGVQIENLAGGVFDFEVDSVWAGVPSATFRNAGTLRKSGGSGTTTLGLGGYPIAFENTGLVEAQTGVISFEGNYTEPSLSAIAVAIGGAMPGTGYSQIRFAQPLTAVGTFTVRLRNGFRPSPGDTFQLLSYPSATNEFDCLNGLDLGDGLLLLPQFTSTSLTLTAATYDVTNTQPQLFITRSLHRARVTWPPGFPNWVLQSTTNLTAPAWEPVSASTQCNNQALVPITGPQEYFRLKQ